MDYRATINLPQTSFPMKAGLKDKEPKMLENWEKENLYQQVRELRKDSPSFILHDGPPYANGDIHVGHALNKILKDIIVRYKTAQGFNSPYIPGWDCHGMPIELKVQEALGDKYKETPTNIMRKKCRKYAFKHIDNQRKQFKRLGVMGEWDNPYLTMTPEYEAEIVSVFAKLVEKGYIYKGLRVIHWCTTCETALASAEIEYNENHTSKSIYVRFPIKNKINDKLDKNVNVMIWTTTPWTLAANMACAFNEEMEYVAVKIGDEYSIMAKSLVQTVLSKMDLAFDESSLIDISMDEIKQLKISHPFIDRESAVVFADYVDDSSGTGIVHTAPGHGVDDYNTGMRYNLEILSPVGRDGRYTEEFPLMQGVHIAKGNTQVIALLEEKGLLFYTEEIKHSYPICWRCKNALIFRATEQWFMNMKHENLEEKAINSLSSLKWTPSWGEERMRSMLKDRPDWCLSRQRAWGVPIPAFYCKQCGDTLLTPESTKMVADIVREKGIDIWFDLEAKELLAEGSKCATCGGDEFGKENDILDVWFDSGISSFTLDKTHAGVIDFPADIYLEGGDQYRGWFQSSIWPSMALRGIPPYKSLITHGWVLDEKGRAMHKSDGNVVNPLDIVNKYGADILRLWCITEDFTHNFRIGENMMQAASDSYRKIRNTFRYLLGNLCDFNYETDKVEVENLSPVDRYALSRLHSFIKFSEEKINAYEYHVFYQRLINYSSVDMSATYLDIIKDRLYCDKKDSQTRRSAQTVLYYMLDNLTRLLAPFLAFTAEEIWKYFKGENATSVHLENFPKYDNSLIDLELEKEWEKLLKVRDDVLLSLERARDNSTIGKSLEASVVIKFKEEDTKNILEKNAQSLNEVFIVSGVSFSDSKDDEFTEGNVSFVKTQKAESEKCVRCWGHYETVGKNASHSELCERCAKAVI